MEKVDPGLLLRQSRMAGFWYFLLALLSPINLMYVSPKLIVAGNAAATATNIQAHEGLFRLGFVTDIAGQLAFLCAALALYELLVAGDKGLARLMAVLVIAAVPISILNQLNQFAALLLLGGADYLNVLTAPQLQALATFFLEMQQKGVNIAEIFWGLWLLPLGILVFKSGFFPKVFGILLVIGCFGYTADSLVLFLFPGIVATLDPVITAAELVSEIPFMLWLLIRGARVTPSVKVVEAHE